jgi:hypothetical protein
MDVTTLWCTFYHTVHIERKIMSHHQTKTAMKSYPTYAHHKKIMCHKIGQRYINFYICYWVSYFSLGRYIITLEKKINLD